MSCFIRRRVWGPVSKLSASPKVHPWYIYLLITIAINFLAPPYTGARKEPDLLIRPDTTWPPSFVIESGWPESKTEFLNDTNLWLVGGAGAVKFVLILQWTRIGKTNCVRGDVELYSLDRNCIPICQQREVLFITDSALGLGT